MHNLKPWFRSIYNFKTVAHFLYRTRVYKLTYVKRDGRTDIRTDIRTLSTHFPPFHGGYLHLISGNETSDLNILIDLFFHISLPTLTLLHI